MDYTKVYVGNLPPNCNATALRSYFEKYGIINECAIINKFAFVHFADSEKAKSAVNILNDREWNGVKLKVELSSSKLRTKPGMDKVCYKCGVSGHMLKECPKQQNRDRYINNNDNNDDDSNNSENRGLFSRENRNTYTNGENSRGKGGDLLQNESLYDPKCYQHDSFRDSYQEPSSSSYYERNNSNAYSGCNDHNDDDSNISENQGPSSRENRGPSSRKNRGPPSRENQGPPSRENRGPPSRENRGPPSRENRGPPSRENRGPPSRENRGPPSRENRGPSPRENRGPSPRENGGPSPRENRGPSSRENCGPYMKSESSRDNNGGFLQSNPVEGYNGYQNDTFRYSYQELSSSLTSSFYERNNGCSNHYENSGNNTKVGLSGDLDGDISRNNNPYYDNYTVPQQPHTRYSPYPSASERRGPLPPVSSTSEPFMQSQPLSESSVTDYNHENNKNCPNSYQKDDDINNNSSIPNFDPYARPPPEYYERRRRGVVRMQQDDW